MSISIFKIILFVLLLKNLFYWRIVALQHCVKLCNTENWFRYIYIYTQIYIYIYIAFYILFHYDLSQEIKYSSLCYNVGPCCFSSVAQSCLTLCDPMNRSTPGLPVHKKLPELAQTHVHQVGDAIQPSHPLLTPSPPDFSLSQHQGLFQWVSSSHQVAKVLEVQLQHQSFQWIFRTDFL